MAENIKLIKDQQNNFTVDAGYFYTFDHDQDSLLQKTDDGNTSFTYPFDTLLGNDPADVVASAEFDGVYFWSLQNRSTGVYIRRWKIDNYVCKLQQTFEYLDSDPNHNYDSEAFSVAHYHTTLSAPVSSGATTINVAKYADDSDLMGFTTTSGDPLTIHLGPNSSGEEEDAQVSTASGTVINLVSGVSYDYASSDEVNFYTYLWVFNNYDGTSATVGALYKFDAYTGDYITRYPGGAYTDVGAATFYRLQGVFDDYPDIDTLAFVKQTNTLFVNAEAAGATLPFYGSMVMENVLSNDATVIPLYDIAMDGDNVYRLQNASDGGGNLTEWSTRLNYELSSLNAFVTSISLAADPAVIAANNVATSNVTAYVRDQFWEPIVGRTVTFSEDDPVGTIAPATPNTDGDGKATTVYTSGTTAREVKITAKVDQT